MELFWTKQATQDRMMIYDYVEKSSPITALSLDEMFEEKSKYLIDHPDLGRIGRITGTRELIVHRNYILVYDSIGDSVRVLRILHAARQWPLK